MNKGKIATLSVTALLALGLLAGCGAQPKKETKTSAGTKVEQRQEKKETPKTKDGKKNVPAKKSPAKKSPAKKTPTKKAPQKPLKKDSKTETKSPAKTE